MRDVGQTRVRELLLCWQQQSVCSARGLGCSGVGSWPDELRCWYPERPTWHHATSITERRKVAWRQREDTFRQRGLDESSMGSWNGHWLGSD
eukprot:768066-Hanusia_phi.AAC.6